MSVDSTWLRCPNCFQDLESVSGRTYGCVDGHRFDQARGGYLTLLPPRAPRTVGDDRAMLEARAELLDSGAYTPIAEALQRAGRDLLGGDTEVSLLDLGCGTGHYAGAVADAVPTRRMLLADRSPDAVRMSMRALAARAAVTGVVLDLWRPLPIRDASADVALDVFAPRNPPEYARVLRSGGLLLIVVPTERHLAELRASGDVLEIPAGKDAAVLEQFTPHGFALAGREQVEYAMSADLRRRSLLVDMGPSAHHRTATAGTSTTPATESDSDVAGVVDSDSGADSTVTVSVDVLALQKL
ncbi:putative RNA methyltransferase [Agromyces sp. G08B096]|uniref:RNA methyltransferase n=1 Tax=Agromyces sp. G08B096 TaxID=3156399 RepID=A0AAU7WB86_9MICO